MHKHQDILKLPVSPQSIGKTVYVPKEGRRGYITAYNDDNVWIVEKDEENKKLHRFPRTDVVYDSHGRDLN